jgi:hypothetical protein
LAQPDSKGFKDEDPLNELILEKSGVNITRLSITFAEYVGI